MACALVLGRHRLTWGEVLTDACLPVIAATQRQLMRLVLSRWTRVTKAGLQQLQAALPDLEIDRL